jgi:hypothetical protein
MRTPTALVVALHSLSLGIFVGQVPTVSGIPLPQDAAKGSAANVNLKLHDGTVKGSSDSYGNSVFLGIPFAESTAGKNRYVSGRDSVHSIYSLLAQLASTER